MWVWLTLPESWFPLPPPTHTLPFSSHTFWNLGFEILICIGKLPHFIVNGLCSDEVSSFLAQNLVQNTERQLVTILGSKLSLLVTNALVKGGHLFIYTPTFCTICVVKMAYIQQCCHSFPNSSQPKEKK